VAGNTVVMEGVKIIFRNFQGKEGKYNKAGDRNFGVLLDDKTANDMAEDNWNVKWLKPREEDLEEDPDTPEQAWLPVALRYDVGKPPRIVSITDRGRKNLDEEDVEMLDWVDITNVDLIVRPFTWDVNGRSGVKAYLQSLYVTIEEDELEKKYADMDVQ
jgi:hypothetical protein